MLNHMQTNVYISNTGSIWRFQLDGGITNQKSRHQRRFSGFQLDGLLDSAIIDVKNTPIPLSVIS